MSKIVRNVSNVLFQPMAGHKFQAMGQWVTEWQGHLLSCSGQLNMLNPYSLVGRVWTFLLKIVFWVIWWEVALLRITIRRKAEEINLLQELSLSLSGDVTGLLIAFHIQNIFPSKMRQWRGYHQRIITSWNYLDGMRHYLQTISHITY